MCHLEAGGRAPRRAEGQFSLTGYGSREVTSQQLALRQGGSLTPAQSPEESGFRCPQSSDPGSRQDVGEVGGVAPSGAVCVPGGLFLTAPSAGCRPVHPRRSNCHHRSQMRLAGHTT